MSFKPISWPKLLAKTINLKLSKQILGQSRFKQAFVLDEKKINGRCT